MEKEILERVYATKPAGKGNGLGLSLCYYSMKNHDGSIEIDSTPGAGDTSQSLFPLNET